MGLFDFAKKAIKSVSSGTKREAAKTHQSKSASTGHVVCRTTAAYQPGKKNNKTVIILSAPGQAEEKAKKPAAGQTGKTLNKILAEAHKKDPDKFPSKNKDDYRIVNASKDVHYKKKTGKTEASDKDVMAKKNIDRVTKALKGKETVVALGDKAIKVAEKAATDKKVVKGSHPSMQAMNKKYTSNKSTPAERASDRVKKYTKDVLKSK